MKQKSYPGFGEDLIFIFNPRREITNKTTHEYSVMYIVSS